jgi:hypothetical protein
VHLYQELLNNSRRQSQPDFALDALFEFRRWLRFERVYLLRNKNFENASRMNLVTQIATSWSMEKLLGFGIRLRNYIGTAVGVALSFATFNSIYSVQLGLEGSKGSPLSFVDSLYFTIITLTTIGYGDITPTTPFGRLFVAGEGIFGFVLFAILASMVYRKILP